MTIFEEAEREADAWVARLDAGDPVLQRLNAIAEDLAHIRSVLDRAMPVINAYLDPAASGPVAWAVRRQIGRNK